MLSIQGFVQLREIYRGEDSVLYRGIRELDQSPVVLKLLSNQYPSQDEVNRLLREHETTLALKSRDGIIQAYALEKVNNAPMLVLEDFQGASLRSLLDAKRTFPLDEVLRIGVAVSDALAEIHGAHVIHKDLGIAQINHLCSR